MDIGEAAWGVAVRARSLMEDIADADEMNVSIQMHSNALKCICETCIQHHSLTTPR